jgi:hypothetical protein
MHLLRTAIAACLPFVAILLLVAVPAFGQDYVHSGHSGTERLPVENLFDAPAPTWNADLNPSPPSSSHLAMRPEVPAAFDVGSFAATEGSANTDSAISYGNSPYESADGGNGSSSQYAGSDRPWGLTFSDVFPYSCDPSLACSSPASGEWPNWGVHTLFGYDAFRGVPQGGWGSYGGHAGFNLGTRLGQFSDWTGIGAQVGGTFGVFNWAGTDYQMRRQNEPALQGFVTYGLFRKATESSHWNAGVVQDWMFNDNFSVFAENPSLSQLRGQVGYATSACNEIGLWGTLRVFDDTREVDFFGPTTWRPINQISAYLHHKWHCGGPDTWLSIGIPEQSRLSGDGSLGDWLVSATAICPFSDSMALYANVMYMHQSASAGGAGAQEDAWNFTTGISFYPGHNARSTNVSGQRWMPLLPVANNGSFLVDASNWY